MLAALLLVAIFFVLARNWSDLQSAQSKSDRTQGLIQSLDSLLSLVKDAETGQRGYLLTGDPGYLPPYEAASKAFAGELNTAAQSLDSQTSTRLRQLAKAKMDELALTIQLQKSGNAEGALQEVRTGRGQREMSEIRQLVAHITRAEYSRLSQNEEDVKREANRTLLVAVWGSALLFAFLCFSSLSIGRIAAKRERVIAALRESRAQKEDARRSLEATLRSIGDGVITTDMSGHIVFMNPVAQQLTGWSGDEARGQPLRQVFQAVHGVNRELLPDLVDQVLQYGEVRRVHQDTCLLRRDGSEVAIDDTAGPIVGRSQNTIGVVLIFKDVGHQRRSEKALEESERRYRRLADSMPQIVWTATEAGVIDYGNERWHQLLGVETRELSERGWGALVHEADHETFEASWQESMNDRQPFQIECQLRNGTTGKFSWYLGRAVPTLDGLGRPAKWFGTFTDIQDRKQVEAELRRANEDLSQFAFSASHDLQEPLRNVIMFTQLFAKRHRGKLEKESEEMISLVVESAQRMEALIRDLLLYVRTGSVSAGEAVRADANLVLDHALSNLQAVIRNTGAVIERSRLPILPFEEVHLQQLFQNLIGNSLKYRGDKKPLIKVFARTQQDECVISVRDNGIGIDPRYAKQVFGLFKRLHGHTEYSGTGIGLAICQKIVERYGGRIWVESEPGRGATFSFTVPMQGEAAS